MAYPTCLARARLYSTVWTKATQHPPLPSHSSLLFLTFLSLNQAHIYALSPLLVIVIGKFLATIAFVVETPPQL